MNQQSLTDCLRACHACADACNYCSVACLDEDNVATMASCIKLDIDCAALCSLAAGFMARKSTHAKSICLACAKICEDCAEECDKHDHEHCKDCAKACRECAAACQKMAA